jgi:hypothetical protein
VVLAGLPVMTQLPIGCAEIIQGVSLAPLVSSLAAQLQALLAAADRLLATA